MSGYRIERLNNLIQEKIGALIVEGRIKDPRVEPFLSVSRVKVSRDISYADVFISGFESESIVEKGVQGLQSAAGFIQSQLASQMHIRQTPKLRFHADTSLRDGFDLVQKLEGLVSEESQ